MRNPKNKFYVAADRMIDDPQDWRKESFNAAVGHAKEVLSRDMSKDAVLIVKVIAIIKRETPITIEKVR